MTATGFAGLSKFMKTVVVVSLALNLLVVGALATAWVRHGGKHWRHGGIERSLMHFAHRKLSRERRRELRKAWHQDRKGMAQLFDDLHEARDGVGKVLQAQPYDRAALEAALETVWQKRSAVRQQMSKSFADLVETLSDDEKQAFGKFIEERKRRKRRHKRW